ncbi:MAG: hypothetical protein JNL42_06995 [Anaerolineae bacterium]|nr:hypothetical protein [Anaerolineae bacterium]
MTGLIGFRGYTFANGLYVVALHHVQHLCTLDGVDLPLGRVLVGATYHI